MGFHHLLLFILLIPQAFRPNLVDIPHSRSIFNFSYIIHRFRPIRHFSPMKHTARPVQISREHVSQMIHVVFVITHSVLYSLMLRNWKPPCPLKYLRNPLAPLSHLNRNFSFSRNIPPILHNRAQLGEEEIPTDSPPLRSTISHSHIPNVEVTLADAASYSTFSIIFARKRKSAPPPIVRTLVGRN